MTESTETDAGDAESLAAIAAARRVLADRLVTPWWYHPAMGLLFCGYTVAMALGEAWVMLLAVLVFFGGLTLLMHAYRLKTGVWLWGHDGGRATPWAYGMGAVAGLGVGGAIFLSYAEVSDAWIWGIAVALGLVLVVVGRQYDRVLRADLRGEL